MSRSIDLNADLGEMDTPEAIARDIALMDVISSCNIACGGHAGTPGLMRTMLTAAAKAGVRAGAHPAYPDRASFGRAAMDIPVAQLCQSVIAQIDTLSAIAHKCAAPLSHIKPHGALYNDLADDIALAQEFVRAVHDRYPGLKIVGLAGGALQQAAKETGAHYIREAFIDRRYTAAARLTPRSQPGAVLAGDTARIVQALSLAVHGNVQADTGVPVSIAADSLCLHSDSPGALETARAVRAALRREGVKVAAA